MKRALDKQHCVLSARLIQSLAISQVILLTLTSCGQCKIIGLVEMFTNNKCMKTDLSEKRCQTAYAKCYALVLTLKEVYG